MARSCLRILQIEYRCGSRRYSSVLLAPALIAYSFNEPLGLSDNGHSVDNVIKSHARLYHFYHEQINGTGMMGLKLSDNFGVPLDPLNPTHVDAANHFNDLQLATFANPIFLGLDYPGAYKMTIPDYVPLSSADLEYIGGTADFFAVDPYTASKNTPLSESFSSSGDSINRPWCSRHLSA